MGVWVVTRFAECATVLRDYEHFSTAGMVERTRNFSPKVLAALGNGAELMSAVMLNLDPPAHTRLRSAIHKSFTPRRVEAFEPLVRQMVHEQIDACYDRRQGDLAELVGLPVTTKVICRLVGLPDEQYLRLRELCNDVQEFAAARSSEERMLECAQSAAAYRDLFSELIDLRLADPQEDLTTDVLQATTREDEPLTRSEALATIAVVVLASFAGVADALHNCLYWLLRDGRKHWQAILDNPDLIPDMVEELLRFDGTTLGLFRFTTKPVTLGGVEIPGGAPVYAMVGSANHDEMVFPDSEQIDPHRQNATRHLAFGYGVHHCIGASLGRLQLCAILRVLRERMPDLRLIDQDAIQFSDKLTRTVRSLPVTW
jgi:cytochrome P450